LLSDCTKTFVGFDTACYLTSLTLLFLFWLHTDPKHFEYFRCVCISLTRRNLLAVNLFQQETTDDHGAPHCRSKQQRKPIGVQSHNGDENFKDEFEKSCALGRAENWYHHMSDDADHKKWVCDFMKLQKFRRRISRRTAVWVKPTP
jgi:hypothetical protein